MKGDAFAQVEGKGQVVVGHLIIGSEQRFVFGYAVALVTVERLVDVLDNLTRAGVVRLYGVEGIDLADTLVNISVLGALGERNTQPQRGE